MSNSYAHTVSCKFQYKQGLFDYEVDRLDTIEHQLQQYRNSDHYIHLFIDVIKQNVIKKVPNLSLLQIHLCVYDNDNILHRLIVTVSNMLREIMKCKTVFVSKKSVFIIITYEDQTVFMGNLDFTGIPPQAS